MSDVVVAILLAIRMLLAVTFLTIPFSNTLHGFKVVSAIAVVIGVALLPSVIRTLVRIRQAV